MPRKKQAKARSAVVNDGQLGPAIYHGCDAQLGYDINVGNGNLHLSAKDIVISVSHGQVLRFTRHYNNRGTQNNVGLGNGWTHTYSWRASMPNATIFTVKVLTATGNALYFTSANGGPAWTPQAGEFGSLTGTAAEGFTYTNKYGTAFTFDTIANSGRLLTIVPADGTSVKVSYSAGTSISSVTCGNVSLSFTYALGGVISTIKDPIGQVWAYDVAQNLNSVSLPNGGRVSYLYQDVVVYGVNFSAGGNASQLTRVTQRQAEGVDIDRGIFSYSQSQVVRAVSSAVDGAFGVFRNDISLTYRASDSNTLNITATLAGGTKAIILKRVSGQMRITSILATAGAGYGGTEWKSTQYQWNPDLTLASLTDGNGVVTTYSNYDEKGNPRTIVEGSGTPVARTTTYTFHPLLSSPLSASRLSVDGVHQHTITYDYDSDYDLNYNAHPTNYLHQIVETGQTDITLSGNLTTTLTRTSKIYYDATYRITKIEGANRRTCFLNYRPDDRLESLRVSASAGSTLRVGFNGYDANGHLTAAQDSNGVSTTMTYDPLGNLLTRTTSSGAEAQTVNFTYNLAGDLIGYTTPNGATVKQEYDGASRMWRRSAETAGVQPNVPWSEVRTFDTQNQITAFRRFVGLGSPDAQGYEFFTTYTRDSFRRLADVQTLDSGDGQPLGDAAKVAYAYEENSNLQNIARAGLNSTTCTRDERNRITQITLPTGGYLTFAYDSNDHVITRRDPRDAANGGSGGDRASRYVYDDFDQLISLSTPDAGTLISNYDPRGSRTGTKDSLGNEVRYSYDGANRLVGMVLPNANESLTYIYDETGPSYSNTAGRLTTLQARDDNGNPVYSHFSYDMLGRVIHNWEERGTDGTSPMVFNTSYTWGENGELLSLTYPDGLVVNYQYPPLFAGYAPIPKPSGITTTFQGNNITLVSNGSYFADGALSGLWYGNGGIRSLTRNLRGEWVHLVSGIPGQPVVDQRYWFDNDGLGLLTSVVHFLEGGPEQWEWTYTYDQLNRLTSYTTNVRPNPDSYTWAYDEVGNRISEVYNGIETIYHYADNTKNQLTSLSGGNTDVWTYNANGFVVTHTAPGKNLRYDYDARSLLKQIYDLIAALPLVSYTYDGRLRLCQRTLADGTWTQYYYDMRGYLLHEFAYLGAEENNDKAYQVTNHVYLGTMEVARIVRIYKRGAVGGDYVYVDDDVQYVHEDFRRSPFGIESVKTNGIGWEVEMDAFGHWVNVGIPGPDGKIGSPDQTVATLLNQTGVSKTLWEQWDDINMSVGLGSWSRPSVGGRLGGPGLDLLNGIPGLRLDGGSPYTRNGLTDYVTMLGGKTFTPTSANDPYGLRSGQISQFADDPVSGMVKYLAIIAAVGTIANAIGISGGLGVAGGTAGAGEIAAGSWLGPVGATAGLSLYVGTVLDNIITSGLGAPLGMVAYDYLAKQADEANNFLNDWVDTNMPAAYSVVPPDPTPQEMPNPEGDDPLTVVIWGPFHPDHTDWWTHPTNNPGDADGGKIGNSGMSDIILRQKGIIDPLEYQLTGGLFGARSIAAILAAGSGDPINPDVGGLLGR
jgi:YD repeat-containing protein